MSRIATQLAGNASSIFEAWLELKRQSRHDTKQPPTQTNYTAGNISRQRNAPRQ